MKLAFFTILLTSLLLGGTAFGETLIPVTPTEAITELEPGLQTVAFTGNDGFDAYLAGGGASSDMGVVTFLAGRFMGAENLQMNIGAFACSTLSAQTRSGGYLFGRNFDWYNCDALVTLSRPEGHYASIALVNMDFLTSTSGGMLNALPERVRTLAALYAPLDGVNEKGLSVAVLMISDGRSIDQNTDRPDVTTTTAIRMLLNNAATTQEAIDLLSQYDMHASMGLMMHLAIADAGGHSVVAEWPEGELEITPTPVVTNFYLTPGERYGVGTSQSMERYNILMEALGQREAFTMEELTAAMESVGKQHYHDGETTEWTEIIDLSSLTMRLYHRENYDTAYVFTLD